MTQQSRSFEARPFCVFCGHEVSADCMSHPESVPGLWALHVEGPDDLYAAPSQEAAEKRAVEFNAWWTARRAAGETRSEFAPTVNAVAVPWPYTPEAHAEDLPDWEEEWSA